jgi:hypothetical protein
VAKLNRVAIEQCKQLFWVFMQLQKTEKGRAELAPGVRTLGQRERTFLLLADGRRSLQEISKVLHGELDDLARRLIDDGYVALLLPKPGKVSGRVKAALAPVLPPASVDAFEGRRSLATTRMFLFDICERMFSKRGPATAEQFREALRNARDRESMLTVSRDLIDEIELVAGHERADSISERIAALLPAQD